MTERNRLDLRGLLPPNVMSAEQQIDRFEEDLNRLALNVTDGPSDTYALAKWRILNRLHDRNETMYYKVLPVMIDVGTNNEKLLNDPMYLGLQEYRLDGEEYLQIMDEFMEAVFTRWPRVTVQFEDFQSKWALKLLQRYRYAYRMFNDDIQGTLGVALAGLLGAVRAQGRPMFDFPKQTVVLAGAGSAGIGVLTAARKTVARMLGNSLSAFESATSQFWVLDAKGLITEDRKDLDPDVRPFAKSAHEVHRRGLKEGAGLAEVVREANPDVLLGLSAVGGLFSKKVLEALKGTEE